MFNLILSDGTPLSLDPDNPTAGAKALQSYVSDKVEAVKATAKTELDAEKATATTLHGLAVDQVIRLRAARVGSAAFDAEKVKAHLESLSADQITFEIQAELDAVKAPEADAAKGGEGATAALSGGSQTDVSLQPDAGTSLAAGGEKKPNPFGSKSRRKATAAAAAILFFLFSGLGQVASAAPLAPEAVAVEAVAPLAAEPLAPAHTGASVSPAPEADPDPIPGGAGLLLAFVGSVATALAMGLGASVFTPASSDYGLRAWIGDCDTIVITAPAGGLVGNTVVKIGAQFGIVLQDAAANADVSCVTRCTDAGYLGKKANVAFGAGDSVYWDADGNPVDGDAGSGAFTNTADAGANAWMGVALDPAAAGAKAVRFQKELINAAPNA